MGQTTPTSAQQPDSGYGTVNLDPYALHETAQKFIDAQKTCSGYMNDLHNALSGNTAAFGGSKLVDRFNSVYGSAADAVFSGFVTAHELLGDIGKGLDVSAQNHRTADEASTPSGQSTTTPPSQVEPEPGIQKLVVPNITGAQRPSWVPDQWDWPVHDKSKTDPIVGAYDTAQKNLSDLVNGLHTCLQGLINANDSDDLFALDDFWSQVAGADNDNTFFTGFADLVQKVGKAVGDCASKIDQSHGQFLQALKDAERTDPLFRNDFNDKLGPINGPDAAALGLPNSLWNCPLGDEDYFFLDMDQAGRNLDTPRNALEGAMFGPGPIGDTKSAADSFAGVMNNVPKPDIETAASTKFGDTLLDPSQNNGPGQDGSPHTGGVGGSAAGAGIGSGVGAAGLPTGSVANPGTGTTAGNGTSQGGSNTDIPGGTNPILDKTEAQRADQQLNQLSPEDKQRFQQLLDNAKSPQEKAYLMKDLAAGHSVDEIASFDNLIHTHGDDPEWLQAHLTPMTNGDAQHPDFTYQGASWTQGQYPAAVAASTVLARAMVDPSYALKLTTGNKPDDPTSSSDQAFLERLRAEEQNVYDQGPSSGDGTSDSSQPVTNPDNAPGSEDYQGQQVTDGDPSTYGGQGYEDQGDGGQSDGGQGYGNQGNGGQNDGGQNYQPQVVGNGMADPRSILASVHHSLDEGKPVPIQQGTDTSQQMVIVGYRGNQLEIYDPSGKIIWVNEDELLNTTMNPVGGGVSRRRVITT